MSLILPQLYTPSRGGGVSTIQFVGSVANSNTGSTSVGYTLDTGSLSGGISSTSQVGDVIFTFVTLGLGSVSYASVPGHNSLRLTYSDDNYGVSGRLYEKTCTSAGESVSVDPTGNTSWSGAGISFVFRGVDTSSPFQFISIVKDDSSAHPDPGPSLTPSYNETMLLVCGATGHDFGTGSYTAPGINGFKSISEDDTYDVTVGGGWVATNGSTYDPPAWTHNRNSSSYSWLAMTVMINPALL